MIILDGKKYKEYLEEKILKDISLMDVKPCLATILVGTDPASVTYVNMKEKACLKLGIVVKRFDLDANISFDELANIIKDINNDKNINGVLIQHPLPDHLDENKIFDLISSEKDVDGLSSHSFGLMAMGDESLKCATPLAVIDLLKYYNIQISGKNVVIIGRSRILGKPLAMMFLNEDATVTICHTKTNNLSEITKKADILVAAMGNPYFIKKDMVKENSILIDCGYNSNNHGDIDPECFDNCYAYTPVPGGVGPVTIMKLLEQVVEVAKKGL